MKYYRVKQKIIDFVNKAEGLPSDIPSANGKFVPDGKSYFDRMGKGEIIKDVPVFDYFYLQSFGKKEDWEWRLQDVHGFIGVGSIITGWYISDKCKNLLEKFRIAPDYHFYETKLLYKKEKIKYWIFQFPICPFQNINFEKSQFVLPEESIEYTFANTEEYLAFYRENYRARKIKLQIKSLVIKDKFDIFVSSNNDNIISSKLKEEIEKEFIEGFLFSEIEYNISVTAGSSAAIPAVTKQIKQ